MEKEKSRFLKNADGTIYDSQTSLTWMANDSRIDLDKEVSWNETERYVEDMNGKKFGGHNAGSKEDPRRELHISAQVLASYASNVLLMHQSHGLKELLALFLHQSWFRVMQV